MEGDKRLLKNLDAQVLFDALPDAAVLLDRTGKIRSMNSAALVLFQYEADEIKGQPIEVLIPARFRIRHIADREILVRGAKIEAWGPNRALMALRKDGTECQVLVKLSTLHQASSDEIICLIRDFSATLALEGQDQSLRSQFQCMGWILAAEHSLPDIGNFHEHVACQSLNTGLDQARKIQVRDLIKQVRLIIQPQIERAGADLILEELHDETWINFYPSLLLMALLGFTKHCVNAVAPLGERWVKIAMEGQGNQLLICLTDSAYRLADKSESLNTFECSISARLLERHGAKLLTSQAGQGRFCLSVPVLENSPFSGSDEAKPIV